MLRGRACVALCLLLELGRGVRMAGGGFGAPKQQPPRGGRRASRAGAPAADGLSGDAAACLAKAGGDLDRAQSLYMSEAARALQARDPAAFARLVAFKQSGGAAGDDGAHETLLALTWDSVAAFMPPGAAPSAEVSRRLGRIARAATAGLDPARGTLLDVGCGDGALLPYLEACEPAVTALYVGIDLSAVMVAHARRAHASAAFEQCSFAAWVQRASAQAQPPAHNCVVLNGAFQFFADQRAALAQAAGLLAPGKRAAPSRTLAARLSTPACLDPFVSRCSAPPSPRHRPPIRTQAAAS